MASTGAGGKQPPAAARLRRAASARRTRRVPPSGALTGRQVTGAVEPLAQSSEAAQSSGAPKDRGAPYRLPVNDQFLWNFLTNAACRTVWARATFEDLVTGGGGDRAAAGRAGYPIPSPFAGAARSRHHPVSGHGTCRRDGDVRARRAPCHSAIGSALVDPGRMMRLLLVETWLGIHPAQRRCPSTAPITGSAAAIAPSRAPTVPARAKRAPDAFHLAGAAQNPGNSPIRLRDRQPDAPDEAGQIHHVFVARPRPNADQAVFYEISRWRALPTGTEYATDQTLRRIVRGKRAALKD